MTVGRTTVAGRLIGNGRSRLKRLSFACILMKYRPLRKSADAPRKKYHLESLICLAAEVDERIYHRQVGKFPLIAKELESIIATHAPQSRGSRALRRCIE